MFVPLTIECLFMFCFDVGEEWRRRGGAFFVMRV